MDLDLPSDLVAYLAELDDFIEREIVPLEQCDDNMRFFDPTYGWAVGEYGTIVRYGTGNVSVDEAISTSLRITPNPVADRVSFNVDAVDQVEIHNATGQLVLRTKGARSSIDVSALPPGCYSIRVAAQGTFRTARFIKE